MAESFKLTGRIDVIQGATTLAVSSNGSTFTGTGINTVGSATVANFKLTAEMDIRNIEEDPNTGAVSFDYYGLKFIRFSQTGTGNTGYAQGLNLYASLGNDNNPILVYQLNTDLGATFDTGELKATGALEPEHYEIEAGQHVPFKDLYIARLLNIGAVSNDEWKFYISGATNTKPPLYTPMSLRKSGVQKTLNNGGEISIRKSGKWQTVPKENFSGIGIANSGHNRIRKNNKWLQQNKIGE